MDFNLNFNKENKLDLPKETFESGNFSNEKFSSKTEIRPENNFNEKNTQPLPPAQGQNQQVSISPLRLRSDKIENTLSDGLDSFCANMSPQKLQTFNLEKEKTAREINKLLDETKVNVKKIVSLIVKWLMLLPGVNMFFIEQEAKIKTDEIMRFK